MGNERWSVRVSLNIESVVNWRQGKRGGLTNKNDRLSETHGRERVSKKKCNGTKQDNHTRQRAGQVTRPNEPRPQRVKPA